MSWFARFALVAVVVLVLQVELFADLRVVGVMPELLLGLSLAAGWNSDPNRGALAGFVAGGLYDLYLATPLGITALSYCLVGYAAGVVVEGVAVSSETPVRRLASMVGVALGLCTLAVIGELLTGQSYFGGRFLRTLLVAPCYTALFMAGLHRAANWAVGERGVGAPGRRPLPMMK